MEHLRCVAERITYRNEQNGYSVVKCRARGFPDLVTVVGPMPEVHVGSVLSLGGEWKVDAKYGQQFAVQTFEETLPATVYGIEKYLGSGLVKGVGPKFARRIVQRFGKDTLTVIEETPDRLNEVPGIGSVRVERIKKSWQEQKEIKNIMLFLQSHDVSTSHATKIFKTYGSRSIEVVRENPYQLADDIWGIGFRTADTIAAKLNVAHDAPVRLRSGLLYTLNELAGEGHCYATRDQLVETGVKLLDVEEGVLTAALEQLILREDVVTEGEAIYLPPFYYAETGTAKRLLDIFTHPGNIHAEPLGLPECVREVTGMEYDETQLQAILTAVESKILILTGGPGTGKTTTTLGIITAYREAGARILLAAPTGRAAKRLSESAGFEAKTIHRLLETKPPEGYQRNAENPLEGDVLIVDECSMIDIMLMYSLLKAVPDHMALIFVGDIDQLPSVDAGNVLRDLIDAGCFPVVRLTRIFRQAQESRIVMNAHRINAGKMPDLSNGRDSDFFFLERSDPESAAETVVELVKTRLPRSYRVPPSDIQVLTPMQRGIVGAANLNQALQAAVNPATEGLQRGGYLFRAGDKVMQIRNNYEKEIFNGDVGVIQSVDLEDRALTVSFDGRAVEYDVSELDELILAYAATIHKAQGSEYPIVVMPVLMSHYVMLQRNLIYTGITRAKRLLVLVGTKKALALAVRTVTANRRNTMLKERLQQEAARLVPGGRGVPGAAGNGGTDSGAAGNGKVESAAAANGTLETSATENRTPAACTVDLPATLPLVRDTTHAAWLKDDLFERLSRSRFRSRFHLSGADRAYVREKGMETIRTHALELIGKRLAPAEIPNDGRQTPMRGHPVFIAQHATGTCCRTCLQKWHGIPPGRALTDEEQSHVADVLTAWIRREMDAGE